MFETRCGVVLAGGRSRRMGGADKAVMLLGEERLIDIALARARAQVPDTIVSAGASVERFSTLGATLIPDVTGDRSGPLAGIYSAMIWARAHRPLCSYLMSFAVDMPFFPADLVERLTSVKQAESAVLATAASDGRLHPVFTLWPILLAEDLANALSARRIPPLTDFIRRYPLAVADYPAGEGDPFANINTPSDLQEARDRVRAEGRRRLIEEVRD